MMATRAGAPTTPTSPTTPETTAIALEQPVHDPESMCRYPSKKCWNARVLKRNGELHNLCDFHRQKANKNQRRLELKRKARAQASADAEPSGKRLRAHKKPRQRTRRAPLSAHLAMREELRAKQQAKEISRNNSTVAAASTGLTSWFLQDLVLLDGVYDRNGFQVKEEQPFAPAPVLQTLPVEMQRLPEAVDQEALDRILQDDAAAVCKSLESISGLEALAALPEGKTSPVDVGESWDNLDFSDYWVTPMPTEQPSNLSFDASAFAVDEDVFVADV
ncbi:hypothetical protein V7S43_008164 [Phytophthora oleae]|uniref:WRC domain-containing protein n=1 Tax=Phytophthora oleae TaxID=2107226 RepID=A0ABD3FJB8_9STRA